MNGRPIIFNFWEQQNCIFFLRFNPFSKQAVFNEISKYCREKEIKTESVRA
jgi:hypothetical protein